MQRRTFLFDRPEYAWRVFPLYWSVCGRALLFQRYSVHVNVGTGNAFRCSHYWRGLIQLIHDYVSSCADIWKRRWINLKASKGHGLDLKIRLYISMPKSKTLNLCLQRCRLPVKHHFSLGKEVKRNFLITFLSVETCVTNHSKCKASELWWNFQKRRLSTPHKRSDSQILRWNGVFCHEMGHFSESYIENLTLRPKCQNAAYSWHLETFYTPCLTSCKIGIFNSKYLY